MIHFQFSNNYSNIFLPGYLYNLRENSMSNNFININHLKTISINYLLCFKLFYRYVKDFNKDLNYLYYDLKSFSIYLLKIKELKIIEYIPKLKELLYNIINNRYISEEFRSFINKLNNSIS